ncbi:MAG: hypothetical protein LC117_10870 [Bacteroidia bacterium]|nr:hypothetical protein [Bacteroidia bacterium]
MKRIALFLSLYFVIITSSFSQTTFEIDVAAGVTNYFGDLGNERVLQTTSTNPGVAITFRNLMTRGELTGYQYNPLSYEVRLSWHRLGYDETKAIGGMDGFELRNYGRGLNFRNDVFGASAHITYTFYHNRRLPLYNQPAVMYLFAGAGAFFGKPKADLFRGDIHLENRYYFWPDGTTRDMPYNAGYGNIIKKDGVYETDLSKWVTETGQGSGETAGKSKYAHTHLAIPFGFGFRLGVSRLLTASLEFGYYYFFTDYLDDVSDAYLTYSDLDRLFPNDPEMQKLAMYISDPTGYGTNGFPGPATSPRGNPKKNDAYSFINLGLAYKFKLSSEKIRFLGRK